MTFLQLLGKRRGQCVTHWPSYEKDLYKKVRILVWAFHDLSIPIKYDFIMFIL